MPLKAVAFNGGTAAKIGMPLLAESRKSLDLIRLPSSSPAYAAVPYAEKLRPCEALRKGGGVAAAKACKFLTVGL